MIVGLRRYVRTVKAVLNTIKAFEWCAERFRKR